MTREEMIRSFVNVPGRCRQQCPYQDRCHHGDFCVFKEAALIMSADKEKIENLREQIHTLRDLVKLVGNYGEYMESRCVEYYDMIHAYNGGVEKKLYIPPRRKLAAKRRKKAKMLRNRELMDGDPKYADPSIVHQEKIEEVVV